MVGGVGLTAVKVANNGGKWPRYNMDRWDRVSLDPNKAVNDKLTLQ
jgi:hypothetical protein